MCYKLLSFMTQALHVRRLGLVEYEDGLAMMRAMVAARAAGTIPDTLLLLHHNPVLTLGRGARDGRNILWPAEDLAARGVEVFETDRGGDVTFHGPGQIVGYPIFDLSASGREDVRRYVRDIEDVIIGTLSDYDIRGARAEGLPGVWVGNNKVCAIGVHISRWITSHGFALNVSTDLSYFNLIVPCGIPGRGVTSMSQLLDRPVSMQDVEDHLVAETARVFDQEPVETTFEKDTVSVYLWRKRGQIPELLMLKRRPDRGGFWQPVTGQVEPGEAPDAAAARECQEETGHSCIPQPVPYVHGFIWPRDPADAAPRFLQEHAYSTEVPEGWEPVIDPQEHTEWRWSSFDEAEAAVPHQGLKRGVRLLREILSS